MDPPEYVREKLALAVSLLVSARTIQDRLFSAYTENLYLLQPDDFPEPLRDDFRDLQEALTLAERTGEEGAIATDYGAIRANTSTMSDEEAEGWAKVILELFTEITRPRAG